MIDFLKQNFDKILPVISLLVGSLMTMINTHFGEARRVKAETKLRIEKRLDDLRVKRIESQREILISLQDELAKYVRFVGKSQHDDLLQARSGKCYGSGLLSSADDEGLFNSQVNVSKIYVRVRDEQIRTMISTMKDRAAAIILADSEVNATRLMQEFG